MTKVYPNAAAAAAAAANPTPEKQMIFPANDYNNKTDEVGKSVVLTVWKKSLLFNCDGFTVFDAKGNLLFRVDNYSAATKGEIILMDASGNSLLTIRRKKLSMSENWMVYEGETTVNPIFSARKHVNLLRTSSLAYMSNIATGSTKSLLSSSKLNANRNNKMYEMEGSYVQRCCTVYNEKRMAVAEIKRKEAASRGVALGRDVFRLIVHPGMSPSLAMSVVIVLDQMFGSSKQFNYRFSSSSATN